MVRYSMQVKEWNARDVRLIQAVTRRQLERIRNLLKTGVDVSKIDPKSGLTAIHIAVMDGQMNIVNLIFNSEHFDVNARDISGRTALQCAVQHARSDVTRRIIEYQPDVLMIDRNGKSALHYACEGGHLGCVQLLLEYNAPVYFKDKDGRVALSYAAERGQASICRLLLENNADVNDVDNENRTSLMIAVNANHSAVADYLIQKGADVNIADNQGRTALNIAKLSNDHNETIKLLEQAIFVSKEQDKPKEDEKTSSLPVAVHVLQQDDDVDGEPEIDSEFRENLSHLQELGEEENVEVDVRLSLIVEENSENSNEIQYRSRDIKHLENEITETIDADAEQFNVEQMRALIRELENENIALRKNAEELMEQKSSLESAMKQMEIELTRLTDDQCLMNSGIVELLEAVRDVHLKLAAASSPERLDSTDTIGRDAEGNGLRSPTVEELDSKIAAIQEMIINLVKSEWKEIEQIDFDSTTEGDRTAPTSTLQRLRLENATLRTRLYQLATDDRQMKRQLGDVERMLALVEEFKEENKALIEDCAKLKVTMLAAERDEADELDRFINAYREMKLENERLKWRIEEMTTEVRHPSQTVAGDGTRTCLYDEQASVGDDAVDQAIQVEFVTATESAKIPSLNEVAAEESEKDWNIVAGLETENKKLRDEIERMKTAIDRQTISMFEMDEELRRVTARNGGSSVDMSIAREVRSEKKLSDGIEEIGLLPVVDTENDQLQLRNAELEKVVSDLSQTIETKNGEIEKLCVTLAEMRQQQSGKSKEKGALKTADKLSDHVNTDDTDNREHNIKYEIPTKSDEMSKPISLSKSRRTAPVSATQEKLSPSSERASKTEQATFEKSIKELNPSSQIATGPPPVVGKTNHLTRRQLSDDSDITRDAPLSELMCDEVAYVCKTEQPSDTSAIETDVEVLRDNFESELSFDLARAMIECEKVVEENRRLRRELIELKAAACDTSDSSTATALSSRGLSNIGIAEEELKRENEKLRSYADELVSEIGALKRTVKEQSMYLPQEASAELASDRPVSMAPARKAKPTSSLMNNQMSDYEEVNTRSFTWGEKIITGRHKDAIDETMYERECQTTISCSEQKKYSGDSEGHHSNVGSDVEKPEETISGVLVESLRIQNESLQKELEATKRSWADYQCFADECRDRLMTEVEQLRKDRSPRLSRSAADLTARLERCESDMANCHENLQRCQMITNEYRSAAKHFQHALQQQLNIGGTASSGTKKLDMVVDEAGDHRDEINQFRQLLESCLEASGRKSERKVESVEIETSTDAPVKSHAIGKITSRWPPPSGPIITDGDRPERRSRPAKHKGKEDNDELTNHAIDDLQLKINEMEAQLSVSQRENDQLRGQLDERRRAELVSAAERVNLMPQVTADPGKSITPPKTPEIIIGAGPLLDPNYEEQLLAEIEDLRTELRSIQSRLREREYELEETKDELLEQNERIRRQTYELQSKANGKTKDEDDVDGNYVRAGEDRIATGISETLDSYKETITSLSNERNRLSEKVVELERKLLEHSKSSSGEEFLKQSEDQRRKRNDEFEAFYAIQERISAENGRLNADLLRCCAERQRAEERCEKLEHDCLAFEELSNEMTERWQKLSSELARVKASSSLSNSTGAATRRVADDEVDRRLKTDANSHAIQELTNENTRLKMILEIEKLKNFASGCETSMSRNSPPLKTAVSDGQQHPEVRVTTAVQAASVTMSGPEIDYPWDNYARIGSISSTKTDDDSNTKTRRRVIAEVTDISGVASGTRTAQRRSTEHTSMSQWTTSVQRSAGQSDSIPTDAQCIDNVESLGSLVSETAQLRSALFELHCLLVDRVLEAMASVEKKPQFDECTERAASKSFQEITLKRIGDRQHSSTAPQTLPLLMKFFIEHGQRLTKYHMEQSSTVTSSNLNTFPASETPSTIVSFGNSGVSIQLRQENARLAWLLASLSELVGRVSLIGQASEGAVTETTDYSRPPSFGSVDGERRMIIALVGKIDELERNLKESETERRDSVSAYRRHLLSAVQGQIDVKVKEALLSIIRTRTRETD